jgi:hypothetical protein
MRRSSARSCSWSFPFAFYVTKRVLSEWMAFDDLELAEVICAIGGRRRWIRFGKNPRLPSRKMRQAAPSSRRG